MKALLFILLMLSPEIIFSQIFYSAGANVTISSGATVISNGGFYLDNSSNLINNGFLQITKNSSIQQAGNINLQNSSSVNGNGFYLVEQDWVNDALFNADNSTVELYGNEQQFIRSSLNSFTQFNSLVLSGTGTGNNRKKTLQNVDCKIKLNGNLSIRDRELETQANNCIVENPSSNAISNYANFGSEGFISSTADGYLKWYTNSQNSYTFPVGSSDGTLRYRPVIIKPFELSDNLYEVRFNNYTADFDNFILDSHEYSIVNLNKLFYHSIERKNGTSEVNLQITYLSNEDAKWTNIAHWNQSENLWKNTNDNTQNDLVHYNSVIINNYSFSMPEHPFVLTNNQSSEVGQELFVPNSFTPDGNEVNNIFESIFTDGYIPVNFIMVIYNRWGENVFESLNYKIGWDGTYNGQQCPDDIYIWTIRFENGITHKTTEINGHVSLLK